jgi:hypothetical protein
MDKISKELWSAIFAPLFASCWDEVQSLAMTSHLRTHTGARHKLAQVKQSNPFIHSTASLAQCESSSDLIHGKILNI